MSEYITIKRAELEQVLEAIEDLRGYRADIDEAITTLRESAQQAEPVAWVDALKDAFFEGFTSVATYNDTLLNSPEEAWENYKPPRTAPPQQAEPAAMYETDVQLVARLPEFHLLCVQDSQGTRFVEDQDTEFQTELLPVVTLCAQVNAEGYPRLVSGPLAGDAQEPAFYGFMSADGTRVDLCFTPNVSRGDGTYAMAYYTTPPQRKPLSEEEIGRLCDEVSWSPRQLARAVERAHGIKE